MVNNRLVAFFRFFLLICLSVGSLLQPRNVSAASLPAEINKQFTPLQIDEGGVSVMRVTIFNPNSFELTGAGWTDNLTSVQPGLYIANPAGIVNTCGGTVSAVPGTANLSLSGATVPPQIGANPGECYVEVNISSVTSGNLINTIPANNLVSQGNDNGTIVNITNTTPASATITVIAVTPPSVSKGFSPNTIFIGEVSRLTITLNNNDTNTNLTGTSYTDTLPAGLLLATPVNATVMNCGAGSVLTATAGTDTIMLSDATVAPSPNCVVAVDVTGASGTYTNTIPAGPGVPGSVQTDQGVTNNAPASANLNIQPVDIDKSFSPSSFQAGGLTTLTITLSNPTSAPYTNVSISDTLPGVFVIANPANITNSCGGTLTAAPGTQFISLSGGTIPASATPPTPVGTCVITVQVTAPVGSPASSSTNTIPANNLNSPDHPGLTNITAATAPISVYAIGTGVSGVKSFNQSTIDPGGNTRLRIDLTAPADTNLTNFSITDNLPAGVTISNSTPATLNANCIGGTLSAPTGGTTISWTGGTINAGTMCRIDIFVTSNTPGTVTNTIQPTDITNDQNRRPANDVTSDLTVRTPSDLTVSKAFYPNQVIPAGISTLTITLQNANASPLVNVSVLDDLTTMGTGGNAVRVAPTPNASTTCGGALTANAGGSSISLSGGTVPAQAGGVPGICTISVDVLAQSNTNTRTNTIPLTNVTGDVQGTGTTINAQANATATLQTLNLTIGVVKGFNPVLVYGGASSTLSVRLINPNTVTLIGITFTDDMTLLGTGMQIANPPVLNVGTCGGTLTGNPGDTSFTFSGGTLAANTTCTLTLQVTMTVNGNLTNRIPAGAVTTLNGVSSPDPTEASLTNLPGVSVSKSFSPTAVLDGQPSTLTITVTNTSLVPVVNMGVTDGLPGTLPTGLEVANPANAANTCGGTLSATPGSQTIQLTGGGLAAAGNPGDVCTISVDVMSVVPGVYVNTIPAGALTANGGITNNDPASASLTVNPSTGGFSLGNRVWFDTDNSSTINVTEVGVDGVMVELYAADAGGNPTGPALGTQLTANGGYYRFDNLPAGDYVVVIPGSQLTSGGPLAGYWSSGTNMSGSGSVTESTAPDPDNDVDSDDNGTRQAGGTFVNAVLSDAVTLGPGANEPTNDTDADPTNPAGEAADAQSNRTVDFGFYRAQLGNLVYSDVNGNGTFDAGDMPLAGATVQLYASDGTTEISVGADGILGTADDAGGGVVTGAGGTYLFSGLPAGDYIVRVTPPAGYVSTVDTASPTDSTSPNTNTDNNDNGVGTGSGFVSSNVVTLTLGSAGTSNNNIVTPSSGTTYDPTLDFGFVQQNTLVADPALSKNGNPSQASVGDTVTFTLTVTNQGAVPAPTVVVTDPLPAMFDVVTVTSVYQAGGNAGTISVSSAPAPYTVTVNLGTLNSTDVVIITITTTVNSLGNPPIINLASLTTTATTDMVSNNSAAVTLALQASNPGSNPGTAVASQRLLLPLTGFAPDVETKLSAQPEHRLYAATDVKLEIPSLGVKLPIVGVPKKNGTWDVAWLGKQAGWLEGTAFPSWSGNSVLTSHVYASNGLAGPFVNLNKLKYGDQIIVHAYGQKYIFEVQTNQVVLPTDKSAFKHEEKPWLTLITCKEYDEKTNTYRKRVVVRAVLVSVMWDK
jgi:LPXTG-site transpeptidase (sortase) family protein